MENIKRKCYISYKFEDEKYKDKIVEKYADIVFIDKSQKFEIDSNDPDVIMSEIRKKYLQDSTVTIFLIGEKSFENYKDIKDYYTHYDSQEIIRREIKSSLFDGKGNSRNGLLGVVLPPMYDKVYGGQEICSSCGEKYSIVNLNDDTVIKEFWRNYYLRTNDECNRHYSEEDRYAVLVKYDDFILEPATYIEKAFGKRNEPIANFVRVKNFG